MNLCSECSTVGVWPFGQRSKNMLTFHLFQYHCSNAESIYDIFYYDIVYKSMYMLLRTISSCVLVVCVFLCVLYKNGVGAASCAKDFSIIT